MTFRVSLLIDADGKAAVQEVRRVEKAQKDAAKASETLNSKSRGAAGGVGTLGTSAGSSAGQVDTMADANRRAAGSMANLTAQGNDVITMLIAGQNPMQLAIQQGTQINQVWGQMGVKGKDAFKLVGGALMSMVSPINLITIGSIAAAGAMANWFANAGPEAKTFEDRMDDLSAAVDEYSSFAKLAVADTSELEETFGIASRQARGFAETLSAAARDRAIEDMKAAVAELGDDLGGLEHHLNAIRSTAPLALTSPEAEANLRDQLAWLQRDFNITLEQAGRIEDAFEAISAAATPDQAVSAATRLNTVLTEVYGAANKIPEAFRDANTAAAELALKIAEITATDTSFDGITPAHREAMEEYYASRIRGEEFLANARAREAADLMTNYQLYAQSRIESDANLAAAQAMLDELQEQVKLQELIAVYGADSAEVAEHRAQAERDVLAQKLETLDVAESVKQEALATFDAIVSNDIATGNWAATMSGVAAEVRGILSALASIGGGVIANASKRIEIEALRAGKSVADARMAAAESQIDMEYRTRDAAASNWFEKATAWADREVQMNSLQLDRQLSEERSAAAKREALANRKARGGGGRRGGGSSRASAADKERDAVEKLITSLQGQLALLRETDPVQKELLRNREALKGATDAEREAVRGLIGTLQEEETALERQADLSDYLKDTGYDLFRGATQGADALADAATRAAEALADAVFQAILLGEGPLAGILGGGDGGLLGSLADSLAGKLSGAPARAAGGMVGEPAPRKSDRRTGWRSIEARAAGGMIYGRGDGTSDDNLTWLSSGEFVTNAKATARNRGLLERINAGEDFPRLAAGGGISGGSTAPGAVQVAFSIDNRSSVPVQGEIEEVPAQGGGRAYKMVLSDMVCSALSTPGGGARRTLKDGFGVKPRGTRR
ncbi:MAG: hypothetical protein EP318_06290 [Rhodobacteraceae bacterium]|nr:MAG: hypothetical protein EP318_06290 [Paracoccaceae bacterium]